MIPLVFASACSADPTTPRITGGDRSLTAIAVRLVPVASGFALPTDIELVPGGNGAFIVLQKEGTAAWVAPDGTSKLWFSSDVYTGSECGLLGMAFHPAFATNGKLYVDLCQKDGDRLLTRIVEWTSTAGAPPVAGRVLLEVAQPYDNHDGGQLRFGPDGMLYIGLGDGGSGGDPHGNGQNRGAYLGKVLRIDVDHQDPGKEYAVPADNPFVGQDGMLPEIWAYGLRNPWRFAFAPDGRLIVADVGQDRWEEVDLVVKGANLGWNTREGKHCFEPEKNCPTAGMTDPIWEIGHSEGAVSITGGIVYAGKAIPALDGMFLAADYATGRMWALDLPASGPATARALGAFGISPSTFGVDATGEPLVADFGSGTIYRIAPAP
jgi:glucose/arabinose dehydrogenase